jgi:hypothetical protein
MGTQPGSSTAFDEEHTGGWWRYPFVVGRCSCEHNDTNTRVMKIVFWLANIIMVGNYSLLLIHCCLHVFVVAYLVLLIQCCLFGVAYPLLLRLYLDLLLIHCW